METGTLKELNVQPGDVVECVKTNRHDWWTVGLQYKAIGPYCLRDDEGDGNWNSDGTVWRIISRAKPTPDLTAITTPFGLLDEATQQALRDHGGPYEYYGSRNEWRVSSELGEARPFAYRVKPQPVRETVTVDSWCISEESGMLFTASGSRGFTPVRVTFDRVNGEIDLSTYRVEPR